MNASPPVLRCRGITKSFGATTVLTDVGFQLIAGRVLGLVGENGAGKSTLMNILGGNLAPSAGTMELEGEAYAPREPRDASRRGIAFIHQELNLFGNLTIAENLFLADFPTTRGLPVIRRRAANRAAADLLARVGLGRAPHTLVDELSAGEQQLVEIAKALQGDARVIIFDEPTTSLTQPEVARLLELIETLKTQGLAIVYISHQLPEIFRLSDDLLVLRDGRVVGQGVAADFDAPRLIALMVGRVVNQLFPARPERPPGKVLWEVRGVSQPGVVRDISFTLRGGEVLGLAGLMGSGRSELARILFGLDPRARGEVTLDGASLSRRPREAIRRGVAFLTEDRRNDGLCLEASIADNLALVTLPAHAARGTGWLRRMKLREALARIAQAVRLTPSAAPGQPVNTLSGGNQQKVVLAKWLLARPGVLILDEPTRGIDIGAKSEIYQLIADEAARGMGVLLISSELEELLGLCDRLLVMRRGELVAEFLRAAFDRERILAATFGTATVFPS